MPWMAVLATTKPGLQAMVRRQLLLSRRRCCGLVVCLSRAAPPGRTDPAVLAVARRQRDRDLGPAPPTGGAPTAAPAASTPAERSRAAGRAQPTAPTSPMVGGCRHARDAAALAPAPGPPPLDLPGQATRPTPVPDQVQALIIRLATENPRWATSASAASCCTWLPGLGQLERAHPARSWPAPGAAASSRPDDVAVVPAPPGRRHPGRCLPDRGHRVAAPAVGVVLHRA
jgi:hypothetical protein